MVQDKQIGWKRKSIYIFPQKELIMAGVAEAGAAAYTEGEQLQTAIGTISAAPNELVKELGALGLVAVGFTTDGDFIIYHVNLPNDLNPNYPVLIRHFLTSNVATNSILTNIIFSTYVNRVKKGAALITAASIPSADGLGFSRTMSIPNNYAANVLFVSPFDVINLKNTIKKSDVENGVVLENAFYLDGANGDFATANILLLCAELSYVPMQTVGEGCLTDRPTKS